MACAFEEWIPGFTSAVPEDEPFSGFLKRLTDNACAAGKILESQEQNLFGIVEEPFFLTSAQLGKVSGDVFEMLTRAILWNCCAYLNSSVEMRLKFGLDHVPIELESAESTQKIAVITLGDNYDLKHLFTEDAVKKLQNYENALSIQNTSLCYSTPDLICVRLSGKNADLVPVFSKPISSLGKNEQKLLSGSRSIIEGRIEPEDILFASGLKTSLRSDRMYQLLFEANAWKFVWRNIFEITPSKYFSVVTRSYGADPEKLHSVEFSSAGNGAKDALRAIDGVIRIDSPVDLIRWFVSVVKSLDLATEKRPT